MAAKELSGVGWVARFPDAKEPSALADGFREGCKTFIAAMTVGGKGKPYEVEHLCAIVCQETAYKWLKWIGKHPTKTIIERCVFDASGGYAGTSRSAFPKNTAAFRKRFGKKLTDLLIEEANITRRLQDYGDQVWVYKGYGIFQYDLQHIESDESFFSERKWYSIR
ncbi:hypothetical protein ACU8L5_25415 (plasmid) [Rhizobium leguminosarum]